MPEQDKKNIPTIYGLYSSRGHDEWCKGADTDPEALRLRYNAHQQSLNYPDPDPEIPEGKRIVEFMGTTSGGLDFTPYCYVEIRIIDQFDKKR